MDADSFTDLALRVLAGEATEGDRRALETELAATPARREEFEQVKLTQAVFRTVAPMAEAAHASEPELPAWRLNELRTAVRRPFGPATKKETLSGGWGTERSGWKPSCWPRRTRVSASRSSGWWSRWKIRAF